MKEKRQIQECCQFRMLKVLVFFMAIQICTNPVISQIISPLDLEGVAYSINTNNSNDISSSHSQKILQWKDKLHIVLTHLASNNQSRFYLVERNDPNTKYIDIPIEYDVRDFSILGDTLYFCGAQTIPNETLTSGFIAYNNIDAMFDGSPSPCKYSNLRSVLVVHKIKTYYNNNKERMVVGIGEQYYRNVTFTPAPETGYDPLLPPLGGKASVNTKMMGHDDQLNLWSDEAEKNWDCFIGYKVVESPNGNGVDNIYDIYRCFFGNTINGNPVEFLRDITLTDDYICLVSNYYQYVPGICNPQNIFIIRRIDKNNLANQVTNRCDAAPSIGSTAHNFNLVKLEHLTGNDIAFSYTSQNLSGLYSNAIYKINLNTNPFTTLISSFIDENSFMRPLLWDLEYLKEENQLLVLKQQSNSNNNGIYSDYVYYISMNNSTILPYTTLAMEVPYNTYHGQTIYWNSLLKYNSNHFALVGNIDNKGLTIYEKDAYSFLAGGNGCNKLDSPIVQPLNNPEISTYPWDLVHCKFLYMIDQNQLLVGVNFLPSQILTNDMLVPAYHKHQITKYCENREINFHLPEPETHE